MKNLYILGNGFDLHHGLNTRYQSFANYLAANKSEIYDLLVMYYGLPDITDPNLSDEEYALWSKFEEALAGLDYQNVLDDNSDLMANPASDEFRDRDWHSYQVEMEMIIEKLTMDLINEFNNFILQIDYNQNVDGLRINFEAESSFLNFNYTESLQKYYNIDEGSITYIHNKAKAQNSEIILGHGTNPDDFKEEVEKAPEGLSDEELYEWNEQKADQYDYSYESAKQEILGYYFKSFKNTDLVIESKFDFFQNLVGTENIFILGHSISPVDIKYFELIRIKCGKDVKWTVSYYSDTEKENHYSTLINLGIPEENVKQIKITDLR